MISEESKAQDGALEGSDDPKMATVTADVPPLLH